MRQGVGAGRVNKTVIPRTIPTGGRGCAERAGLKTAEIIAEGSVSKEEALK